VKAPGAWEAYGSDLANYGYRVTWTPAGLKHPRRPGWQQSGVPTPEEVAAWSPHPGRGICLVLGSQGDGTVIAAIDADIRDPKVADKMRKLLRQYGVTAVRYGQRPKFATLVRIPEEIGWMDSGKFHLPGDAEDAPGHHVEVRCAGQELMIYGDHREAGVPYTWEGGAPAAASLSDWPELSLTDVEAIVSAGNKMLRDAGGVKFTPGKLNADPPRVDDPTLANPVLHAGIHALLDAAGLIHKRQKNGGALQIDCPFIDEHSDRPATGTALMPGGGISCHHASCNARTIGDYIDRLKEMVGDDADEIQAEAEAAVEAANAEAAAAVEAEFLKTIGRRKSKPTSQAQEKKPEGIWDEPVDILSGANAVAAPVLQPDHLPDALAPYVFDTAARMGVDPTAVAMSALTALSTVVSEDWSIQPKRLDTEWTVTAILWTALVGNSAILKSPIMKAVKAPLEELETRDISVYDEQMGIYAFQKKMYDKAVKGAKAISDVTDQFPEGEPKRPRRKRYIVNNTTIDALTEVLRRDAEAKFDAPAKKVLVYHEEMSEWAANFDRYSPSGTGGDRGAYLRLRDGGPSSLDRVIRGSFHIPSWAGSFLGGIQIEPIRKIANHTVADGLLPRFFFVVSERQERGVDRVPDKKAIARYEALFAALAALRPVEVKLSGRFQPVVLDAKARRYFNEAQGLIDATMAKPGMNDQLVSALGKWAGFWAQLALLFHLITIADAGDGDPGVVSEAAAGKATALMRDILYQPALIRTHGPIGEVRWT
jgi:hypothetical protein